jgi:uncharacterized protein (TIGR03437 family)
MIRIRIWIGVLTCHLLAHGAYAQIQNVEVLLGGSLRPGITRPGGISTVTCSGLANVSSPIDRSGPAVYEHDGLSVLVNGIAARLLAVNGLGGGYHRIDFLVPPLPDYTVGGVTVTVKQHERTGSVNWNANSLNPDPYRGYPADFFLTSEGYILGRHSADQSLIDRGNPVRPGEQITLYATGMGAVIEQLDSRYRAFPLAVYGVYDGRNHYSDIVIVFRTDVPLSSPVFPIVTASFAGLLADEPGVYRIDVQVPEGLTGNELSITLWRDVSCSSPCGQLQTPRLPRFVSETRRVPFEGVTLAAPFAPIRRVNLLPGETALCELSF